jgi:S1-C subfamily serine protease
MKVFSILFIAFFSFNLYSQVLTTGPVNIPFVNLPKRIAELKKSSVSIEKSDKNLKSPTLVGSGFMALKKGILYAVTNYHVINNIGKDQIILVGFNAEMKKQYAFVEQTFIDEKNDIAVLKMGKEVSIQNSGIDTTLTKPAAIGPNLFATPDNIIEGSGAIIIGYPLGLGSEYTGNRPVSRIGIIAQGPNYKKNTFLLDCTASHGNSGSPVFSDQTMKLIGMVTGMGADNINLYDSNEVLKASLPYNSGITICVTAEMINKIIP